MTEQSVDTRGNPYMVALSIAGSSSSAWPRSARASPMTSRPLCWQVSACSYPASC
jgi:hypothetical protein